MKKVLLPLLFTIVFAPVSAQIHMTALGGVNSTRISKGSFGFEKGGNYLFGGLELEARIKPKGIRRTSVSFVTGASYLNNGYFENSYFSLVSLFYTATRIELTTTYVQIPVMVKLNWQPFPLMEDFSLYFSAGVSNNLLTKAHLTENITKAYFAADAPQQTTHYQDSQDITQLGVRSSMSFRFDIGMQYKRLMIAFRLSQSLGDMYYQGLEKVWAIPATESGYISGHKSAGTTKEKYSELIVGFRIF